MKITQPELIELMKDYEFTITDVVDAYIADTHITGVFGLNTLKNQLNQVMDERIRGMMTSIHGEGKDNYYAKLQERKG